MASAAWSALGTLRASRLGQANRLPAIARWQFVVPQSAGTLTRPTTRVRQATNRVLLDVPCDVRNVINITDVRRWRR